MLQPPTVTPAPVDRITAAANQVGDLPNARTQQSPQGKEEAKLCLLSKQVFWSYHMPVLVARRKPVEFIFFFNAYNSSSKTLLQASSSSAHDYANYAVLTCACAHEFDILEACLIKCLNREDHLPAWTADMASVASPVHYAYYIAHCRVLPLTRKQTLRRQLYFCC